MAEESITVEESTARSRFPSGFPGATEGEALAKLVEYAGVEIPAEAKAELEQVTEAAAIAALLDANLGETVNVKPLNAQRIFGTFLMQKMKIQPLLMAWWYQNLAAAQDAIKFCQEELRKPAPELKEGEEREPSRDAVIKHYNNAVLGMATILEKMQDMAREVGLMQVEKKPTGPKNRPPDVFQQFNVVVQPNASKVSPAGELPHRT